MKSSPRQLSFEYLYKREFRTPQNHTHKSVGWRSTTKENKLEVNSILSFFFYNTMFYKNIKVEICEILRVF